MKNQIPSMLPWKSIAIGATALLSSLSTANAVITLDFAYDPGLNSVTASYSGTWGASGAISGSGDRHESSSDTFYSYENGQFGFPLFGSGLIDPYPWLISVTWTSWTGDSFGFDQDAVYGPVGFTSSTNISGSMTRAGSLTDLGFADNDGGLSGNLIGFGGSSNTVNWSTTVVPEPSSAVLFMSAIALAFVGGRRKRVC